LTSSRPTSVVENGSDEDTSGQDEDEESDFELQLEAERCDEAEEEIALEQHLLDTGASTSVLALPASSFCEAAYAFKSACRVSLSDIPSAAKSCLIIMRNS